MIIKKSADDKKQKNIPGGKKLIGLEILNDNLATSQENLILLHAHNKCAGLSALLVFAFSRVH